MFVLVIPPLAVVLGADADVVGRQVPELVVVPAAGALVLVGIAWEVVAWEVVVCDVVAGDVVAGDVVVGDVGVVPLLVVGGAGEVVGVPVGQVVTGGAPAAARVAAVTTWLPSMVRVIGLATCSRLPQPRLVNDWLARMARKVNRLVAIAASTEGAFWNMAWS